VNEVTGPKVDPSNTEQAMAWNGDEGAYWADHAEHFDRGVAGCTGIQLEPHREAMWLGADAEDARRFALGLLGWMLDGHDDDGRRRAVDNLAATLTAHDTGDSVLYGSATWTIWATRP
jgi:hypothetical protein